VTGEALGDQDQHPVHHSRWIKVATAVVVLLVALGDQDQLVTVDQQAGAMVVHWEAATHRVAAPTR